MKRVKFLVLTVGISILCNVQFAKASYVSQAYETFTPAQLDAKIKANPADKYLFVIIGTSWCGWCEKLEEYLDQTATIDLIKVDGDTSDDVDTQYKAQGYPTMLVFKGARQVAETVGFDQSEIAAVLRKSGALRGDLRFARLMH